jgi:hypothetical protein
MARELSGESADTSDGFVFDWCEQQNVAVAV